jgi:hypothetical protein
MRTSPNVIITGTPGVGKTVHCEQLAQEIGLKHLSINQVAKDRGCFDEYDEELKTWVVDEDKVRIFPTMVFFPPGSLLFPPLVQDFKIHMLIHARHSSSMPSKTKFLMVAI